MRWTVLLAVVFACRPTSGTDEPTDVDATPTDTTDTEGPSGDTSVITDTGKTKVKTTGPRAV